MLSTKFMTIVLRNDFLLEVCDKIKVLGHPLRIKIVEHLEKGDASVSQIMKSLDISQPITSQHLLLMKSKGILRSRREGNVIIYSIKDTMILGLLSCLRKSQQNF